MFRLRKQIAFAPTQLFSEPDLKVYRRLINGFSRVKRSKDNPSEKTTFFENSNNNRSPNSLIFGISCRFRGSRSFLSPLLKLYCYEIPHSKQTRLKPLHFITDFRALTFGGEMLNYLKGLCIKWILLRSLLTFWMTRHLAIQLTLTICK